VRLGRDGARGLALLKEHGLLLVTDPRLPSLVALLAGGPVRGSWWGHERGQAIFTAASELEDHPDVALVKLVAGKATFVHRSLWPALLAVGGAGAAWQTGGLPAAARTLRARVEKEGTLRADRLSPAARSQTRILELRLLVHAASVHTETGAHAKALESWSHWAKRRRVRPLRSAEQGRQRLEAAAAALAAGRAARARLPWE